MKKKELKNFAKKIASLEYLCQTSTDSKEIARAQNEIMKITNHIGRIEEFEELEEIDIMVQEILAKEYDM